MHESPRFSVLIPTRNRAETLSYTLASCLDQDFQDYEIVVCDNFSDPQTKAVVDAANSPKLRYVRSARPLFMSDNWELAVSHARGRYITLIGDDDGLMPYALRELDRVASLNQDPPAIHWHRAIYAWPDIAVPDDANFLRIPMGRAIQHHNSRQQLLRFTRYELGADMLPMIYNSIIRRDVLEILKDKAGRVFSGVYPDIYSGFAIAYIAAGYMTLTVPMHIAGLGGKSTGVSTLMRTTRSNDLVEEFELLRKAAGFTLHPTTPKKLLSAAYPEDAFQTAKQLLFPDDVELCLNRKEAVRRWLRSIPTADPKKLRGILRSIRDSLSDQPDLQAWFDTQTSGIGSAPLLRMKPKKFGFDGQTLTVNTAPLGVRDVRAAVQLATKILGLYDSPLEYDL